MLEDTGIADAVRGWSIEGAGFDRGVRFQLAATRGVTVNNIEPQPTQFQIDLFLEQVSIVVPALKAAKLIRARAPHRLTSSPIRGRRKCASWATPSCASRTVRLHHAARDAVRLIYIETPAIAAGVALGLLGFG